MKIIKTKKYAQLKDANTLKSIIQSYIDFLQQNPVLSEDEPEGSIFKNKQSDFMIAFFNVLIDGIKIEELFFDKLTEKGFGRKDRDVIQHLQGITPIPEGTEEDKVNFIREIFNLYYDISHPVRNNLFYMDSIPEVNEWLDKNSKARNY